MHEHEKLSFDDRARDQLSAVPLGCRLEQWNPWLFGLRTAQHKRERGTKEATSLGENATLIPQLGKSKQSIYGYKT